MRLIVLRAAAMAVISISATACVAESDNDSGAAAIETVPSKSGAPEAQTWRDDMQRLYRDAEPSSLRPIDLESATGPALVHTTLMFRCHHDLKAYWMTPAPREPLKVGGKDASILLVEGVATSRALAPIGTRTVVMRAISGYDSNIVERVAVITEEANGALTWRFETGPTAQVCAERQR